MKSLIEALKNNTVYDKIQFIHIDAERRAYIESAVVEQLSSNPRIQIVVLFGSVLGRDYVRDVDVAIQGVPPFNFEELLKIGTDLEIRLRVPVDLVQLTDLNPDFRLRILLDGKPLLIKNSELYHSLVGASVSEREDFQITLREVLKRIKPDRGEA